LAQALFDLADALWQQENTLDSLTTVAASHLLSLGSIYDGVDGGLPYLRVGIDMA